MKHKSVPRKGTHESLAYAKCDGQTYWLPNKHMDRETAK